MGTETPPLDERTGTPAGADAVRTAVAIAAWAVLGRTVLTAGSGTATDGTSPAAWACAGTASETATAPRYRSRCVIRDTCADIPPDRARRFARLRGGAHRGDINPTALAADVNVVG
jgi:hypothetical protein